MARCSFFLGTHMENWLEQTAVPLFISARRLRRRRRLPRALGVWALDSGGFSELLLHGRWLVSAKQYVGEVQRWAAEIGGMAWVAAQDWMCEPGIRERTGLSVAEHQHRTVRNYIELLRLAPELPWVPVLQGWERDDYLRHLDEYARAGVDLRALPVVGLGSVCRRQATGTVEGLVRGLTAEGLRLHGFGFKSSGLLRVADVLTSADSMAWSFRARRSPPLPDCRHRSCANCLRFALSWRRRLLEHLDQPLQRQIF